MMLKILVVLLAILTLPALADTIILKSGRSFSGQVLKYEDGIVTIRTANRKLTRGKISKIKRIEFSQAKEAVSKVGVDINSFENLLGGYITAQDGQFLGKITTSDIDSKSLLNDIGKHGSDISNVSIFNDISKYGDDISQLSPFNDIASQPPKIFHKEGKFVAYLTTNEIKTPAINPHALIGWLKSNK